jgi:hypothetical protein
MINSDRHVEINSSGIPVNGIGGLGLVAACIIMAFVLPEAMRLLVLGLAGGVLLAGILIKVHRRMKTSGPNGDSPAILFREDAAKKLPTRKPTLELHAALFPRV